ncbi:hypothetical protein Tco_1376101 [Tanacetum coccineum]
MHVQLFLTEDMLETLVVGIYDALCPVQVVSPDLESEYNCIQFQVMGGVILFVDLQPSRARLSRSGSYPGSFSSLQDRDRKLIICGDMIQRKLGSFVSFREMITSQLQGKLWLYDEVRTRLCLVLVI